MNTKYAGIALILIAAILFFSPQDVKIGIFSEELGDMQIVDDVEDNIPANEAIDVVLRRFPSKGRYYATYQSHNDTMQIWAEEFDSHDTAYDVFENVKTIPYLKELNIPGMKSPVVQVNAVDGKTQYYYLKKDRIFVVRFENSDMDYQMSIIKEVITNV
ncbi:MAG: hypothetical protein M8353_03920 [ANME-2 cluster archaeon]|nr:hypothetical protein [ANME-2 cluster archaeon]